MKEALCDTLPAPALSGPDRPGSTSPSEPPASREPRSGERPSIAPEADPSEVLFTPPERVDEYTIIKPIGSGTMGQVYLGRDTVLARPVAVKFMAAQPTAEVRERFLTEARAIARLQHPNIISIFRVGEAGDRPYLVSEFLDGKSLDHRTGPLAWTQVLKIGLSLASALAAAHRQGVLHRDIKPANVMVTRDGAVKLLDFGLAKLKDIELRATRGRTWSGIMAGLGPAREGAAGDVSSPKLAAPRDRNAQRADDDAPPSSVNVTAPGALVGTPAFMAPEVWLGEDATERSDIYSLGALLYDLAAGEPPHTCADMWKLRRAALELDAAPLAAVKTDINPRLAAAIDRCLRRDPDARFSSAEELRRELDKITNALSTPSNGAIFRSELRRRWPIIVPFAVILFCAPVALLAIMLSRLGDSGAEAPAAAPRRAVAMLGFLPDSSARQSESAAAALSELLGEELVAGRRLRLVPAETIARMRAELSLPAMSAPSADVNQRLHRHTGAELAVKGAVVFSSADELEVRVVVEACPSGVRIANATARGRVGDLFELATALGAELRGKLNGGELSEAEAKELRAARPLSPEVAQLFAQGQERMRRFDPVGARDILARAVGLEPHYALGHFALAGAWSALGHDVRARASMERALQESKDLSREQRTLIEARYRELNKEWEKALHHYRALFGLVPDNLEYGLYLAEAQLSAGQIPPALATISQLRRLPAPASEDPRLNIAEARAAMYKGDYNAAIGLLEASVRQGESMAAPLLIARARLEMSFVYEALGRHGDALESARKAQKVFAAAGDRAALADALLLEGTTQSFLGELDAATRAYDEALSNLLEIENNALVAILMSNFAIVLTKQGRLDLALARAEAGLMWGRELESKSATAAAEIAIGWIAGLRGELPRAEKHIKKAEAIYSERGDPRMVAWARYHKARLLGARGQLQAAIEEHEAALAIREKHGLEGFAAESRAALAELHLERGEAAPAADLARHAADQFGKDGQAENEALARALLGEALTALGKKDEAAIALTRAAELRQRTQNALVRVQVGRLLAEVRGGSGGRAELAKAKVDLEAALADARRIGALEEELRVEVALARVQRASGDEEGAKIRLARVAEEASRRGFGSIAAAAVEPSNFGQNPVKN